jgi:GH15 family glucan-1,4-alpha-glucosidase
MPYQAIENYGVIGNMRTAALVGSNGSLDWYCAPHFDSPSVFGAILDDLKGGRFQISPMADQVRAKQSYWPSTNILVTRFAHADGIAELEDFMPVGLPPDSPSWHNVYRRIRCVRGTMRISLLCRPAFDYGRAAHETSVGVSGAIFNSKKSSLALCSEIPLEPDGRGGVTANFVIEEGKSQVFTLRDHEAKPNAPSPPSPEEVQELFQHTVKFWQHWITGCTYRGRWRELVE